MLENSWSFASDNMYLQEILLFHEKVKKLYWQYNGLRRLNGIAFIHVHQETIPDTKRAIDHYAGQNRRLNFT